MPFNLQREHLQFLALLMSVPLQYILMESMGSSEGYRIQAIAQMKFGFQKIKSQWFRIEPWKKWGSELMAKVSSRIWRQPPSARAGGKKVPPDQTAAEPESGAEEVFRYRLKKMHFARSTVVRKSRPPHLRYRVGQVVRDKVHGYRGVIIGWDLEAQAPEPWIQQVYGGDLDLKKRTQQPHYAILCDARDMVPALSTYVGQENLEVLRNTRVLHPDLSDHFENYDGAQYLPRPWVQAIYPRD